MSKRLIKLYPSLQELIASLCTAVVVEDGKLNKQQTSHDDILDSFRLSLWNYEPPKNLIINNKIVLPDNMGMPDLLLSLTMNAEMIFLG